MSDVPHDQGGQRALEGRQKDAVKAWAPKVRRSLEDEFTAQLKRLGLKRNGRHDDVTTMSLQGGDVEVRQRLEALLKRETVAEGSPERGFATVVDELAYTLLNRLVGLKAMEARGLLYLPSPGHPGSPPELTEVLTRGTDQAYSRFRKREYA